MWTNCNLSIGARSVFPHTYRSPKPDPPGYNGCPGPQPKHTTAQFALYNLRQDPGEMVDVQEKFPEVVSELEKLADQYREELGDAHTNQTGTERRAPAQVKRN